MKETELKALVSLLDDEGRSDRLSCRGKNTFTGTTIIPFLEEEWESNFNPTVQRRIEEIIHTLQYALLKERIANWYATEEKDLLTGMVVGCDLSVS
jgi:hypothetical protein